jgi:hypothetical protein
MIFPYDVLTFSLDRTKLGPEVSVKFPSKFRIETGEFLVNKIPTRKNGIKSLCLVRCMSQQELDDLASIQALQLLGTYDEVFADTALLAKYNSVYDQTPQTYNVDGIEYINTPPDRIGEFA